jgi:hypothetical protein
MKQIKFALFLVLFLIIILSHHKPNTILSQGTNRTYTTGIVIQNLTIFDSNVRLDFHRASPLLPGKAEFSVVTSIPGSSSITYAPLPTQVSNGFAGSLIVFSERDVGMIVNTASPNLAADFGGGSYVGSKVGSTRVFIPIIFKNYSEFTTFFYVQNIGRRPTIITITYSNNTTESTILAPNETRKFDQSNNNNLPTGFNGSAKITSSATDIVVNVTQVKVTTLGSILSYNGAIGTAYNPVFPIVQANNSNYFTGINIYNTGSSDTSITVRVSVQGVTAEGNKRGAG